MDWLPWRAGITDHGGALAPAVDEVEIVELDPEPRVPDSPGDAPAEPPYLRDRRDPTGTAGLWRAIEGL
jgi:hypothetical protein